MNRRLLQQMISEAISPIKLPRCKIDADLKSSREIVSLALE
jgi:hypothetical protein